MAFTHSALALLLACWVLQAAGAWMQWRNYQQSVASHRETWAHGYLGVGKHRQKFGFGALAIVVVSPELVVKKVQVMTGFSVLARFKDVAAWDGMPLQALASAVRGEKASDKVSKAIQDAIQRIEEVRRKS